MDQNILHRLTEKINQGLASEEEVALFNTYLNAISKPEHDWASLHEGGDLKLKNEIFDAIQGNINKAPEKSFRVWRYISAAAILLILGIFSYQFVRKNKADTRVVKVLAPILPGQNKATLLFADGKSIVLSTKQEGIIANDGIRYGNGEKVVDELPNLADPTLANLAIKTPKGGTYTVVLSDGTKVWLNADSRLDYPAKFNESDRIVRLKGEAYFEVVSKFDATGKKQAFKVITDRQTIEVLGTKFNVNAYNDANSTKTTLVEGKVGIDNQKSYISLKPGEQAVNNGELISLKKVNTEHFTDWKDGKFNFDSKTFVETMADIGRWYDLDVIYPEGIPDKGLIGDAYRNEKINFVEKLLAVARIQFKLDRNKRQLIIFNK